MEIRVDNGYIKYTIEDDEVIIDMVEVYEKRQGTGRILVEKVLDIARDEEKDCTLACFPQDDAISKSDLCMFYESLGFECDYRGSKDEADLYIYRY